MKERKIEAYLVKQVKALGGEVRKVRWIGRRGAPDRFVIFPGVSCSWIELKRPGKRPTPAQRREMNRLIGAGAMVSWANTCEMVDDFLYVCMGYKR